MYFGVAKMLGHIGTQCTFDQMFGQLLEKSVLANEVFWFFVACKHLPNHFDAYDLGSYFWIFGSFLPFNRLTKNLGQHSQVGEMAWLSGNNLSVADTSVNSRSFNSP